MKEIEATFIATPEDKTEWKKLRRLSNIRKETMEIETLKLDTNDKLANVITLKTNLKPEGIRYIKSTCLDLELLELKKVIENISNTLHSYKIIVEEIK